MLPARILLPDGFAIVADVAIEQQDKAKGLAGIASLPEDRGMLFVYDQEGFHPYWMRGCLIPLDIVWMDARRRIVEVCADCPADGGYAKGLMTSDTIYGGHQPAQYVLEIGAGQAARHGLQIGTELKF